MSSSSSSQSDNVATMNDVLLYAQSRITRKQAVREIGEMVLRANMKPRTVKQALQLIKAILPPDNTLPSTVQELFGAMLSSENDWRLAQYLIRHKQQPSFSPSPLWSNSSTSNASSSTTLAQLQPSMFLPVMSSSSESESDNDNASATSDSDLNSDSDSDSDSEDDDENDDDDDNEEEDEDEEEEDADGTDFLTMLRRAHQQQPAAAASTLVQLPPLRVETDPISRPPVVTGNSTALSTEQRSQIASNPLNRFAFLGSFKRQRSESSSSNEPSILHDLQLSDGESDDEDSFYSLNNNPQSTSSNMKSRCFEMNGCDLLDGGPKRRRH